MTGAPIDADERLPPPRFTPVLGETLRQHRSSLEDPLVDMRHLAGAVDQIAAAYNLLRSDEGEVNIGARRFAGFLWLVEKLVDAAETVDENYEKMAKVLTVVQARLEAQP